MKCPEVRENLVAYLDGEVDGAPRRAMDAHLANCGACAAERSAQAAVWRLLDVADAPAAPVDFDTRVLAAARTAGSPRGRILGLPLRTAAAAAAVLLAAGGGLYLLRPDGTGDAPSIKNGDPTTSGGTETAAAPPEALLENLAVLESLDLLQDADFDVVDRLSDMEDEDLAVLGG